MLQIVIELKNKRELRKRQKRNADFLMNVSFFPVKFSFFKVAIIIGPIKTLKKHKTFKFKSFDYLFCIPVNLAIFWKLSNRG